jgi:tRNA (cmo5U34)-methyltransferase
MIQIILQILKNLVNPVYLCGDEMMKSTVEQIRERFDRDVERFSNLETGQSATVDAPLTLELIASVAAATTPTATHLLDIGCGAGNYTLKILQHLPDLNVTLIDLSKPMLDRAVERIRSVTKGEIKIAQADIRDLDLGESQFDIIVAAAVFHHLREEREWSGVFRKCHRALRPGGSIWISDLVAHPNREVQGVMWERYGEYLEQLRGPEYREQVFAYIEQEDTPRPLLYQVDLLREIGFREVEILHKNGCFAAFGAIK